MYLIRSVEASHLSDKDLRLTLLSHFDKPLVVDKAEAENFIERCESGFERDVYVRGLPRDNLAAAVLDS